MRHLIDLVENASSSYEPTETIASDRFQANLLELFDTNNRVTWRTAAEDEDEYVTATFVVNDYRYICSFLRGKKSWEFIFEMDFGYRKGKRVAARDSVGITGTGYASQVFSNALQILSKFISRYSPEEVTFSADEASRQKLYSTMIRRLSDKMPSGYSIKFRGYEWAIIKDTITESSSENSRNAQKLVQHFDEVHIPGARCELEVIGDDVAILWLEGGGGAGKKLLQAICDMADRMAVTLRLVVEIYSKDDGGKLACHYYPRFGFEPDHEIDFDSLPEHSSGDMIEVNMVRMPMS